MRLKAGGGGGGVMAFGGLHHLSTLPAAFDCNLRAGDGARVRAYHIF